MQTAQVRRAVPADRTALAAPLSDMQADATNTGAQRVHDRPVVPRQDMCCYRLAGVDLRRVAAA